MVDLELLSRYYVCGRGSWVVLVLNVRDTLEAASVILRLCVCV